MIEAFNISVVQPAVRPVFRGDAPFHRAALRDNLARACEHVLTAAKYFRSRIVVFPEFFLHGFQMGRSNDDWIGASVRVPGPETDQLAKVARQAKCYVAGMTYEVMPEFPGRFWNTAFIIDPEGKVALRYHKLYAMTGKTRPGDVYDQYKRQFGGPESLFPVLRTPYGNLGCLVCYDINFPEVTRCLALRGAEIFLHISSEGRSSYHLPDGGWESARRTRAYENIAYLAMSNCGPAIETDAPADFSHGHSQIIDFNGRVLNMAESAGETIITAEIDIEALRRRRARASLNFLAELSPQIHAPIFAAAECWPTNHWADTPMTSIADNRTVEADVIARMQAAGVLTAPASGEHAAAGRVGSQE
ncbi:MAG TPA: nitrilase-related carbon-nitrogen hydrolase [Steroidobacteraceae bacterium]|nr:nitrilase-related carbon-nitrogen hydrolase [Steroidobacteraceae bacterium]HRX89183.1 nitrilase-related carbon-nitrogen hydrolase [Steroidobacteraceae bacterium]